MKTITVLLLFYTSLIFSQTKKEIEIRIIQFNTSGKIMWTTTNEKKNTTFIIEELRWGKWEAIGQLKGKGQGDNSYNFLTDTTCGIYQVRINAKDSKEHYSKIKKYPTPKNVEIGKGCGNFIRFTTKTKYKIFEKDGGLEIISSCGNYIDLITLNLKRGAYIIYYDFDTRAEFLSRGSQTKN